MKKVPPNNLVRQILISFTALLILVNSAYAAHDFSADLKTEVQSFNEKQLRMKVVKVSDSEDKECFPQGTVFIGDVTGHKPNRRLMRDEVYYVKLHTAVLPNGSQESIDQELKVKPRKFLSTRNAGTAAIVTTGGILGLTIDFLTIGLPVARGGKALWEACWEVSETPEDKSKLKAGSIGFVRGALFPLPEIFLKADTLPIEAGNQIKLYDAKPGKRMTGVWHRKV